MNELNDESIMTFGKKHANKRLADVPGEYYFWMWEMPGGPQLHAKPEHPYHRYIVKNWRRICQDCPDYDPENHPPRDTRTATQPINSWSKNPELPQPGMDY